MSQSGLEPVTTEPENNRLDKEILKERYTSAEERQKIIDDLRLV